MKEKVRIRALHWVPMPMGFGWAWVAADGCGLGMGTNSKEMLGSSAYSIPPSINHEIEGESQSTLLYLSIISFTHSNYGGYYISSLPCFSIAFIIMSHMIHHILNQCG